MRTPYARLGSFLAPCRTRATLPTRIACSTCLPSTFYRQSTNDSAKSKGKEHGYVEEYYTVRNLDAPPRNFAEYLARTVSQEEWPRLLVIFKVPEFVLASDIERLFNEFGFSMYGSYLTIIVNLSNLL